VTFRTIGEGSNRNRHERKFTFILTFL